MDAIVAITDLRPIDYGSRLRAGVIVPSGNPIAEPEIRAMLPNGVSALVTRLPLRGSSEPELLTMLDGLEAAAGLLADAGVGVIVFHCTAVSTFAPHLAGEIRARIARASGIPAFATSDAVLAACATLGAKRISLLTPYIEAVHRREIDFLTRAGLDVVGDAHLGIATNDAMARLSPLDLLDWASRTAPAALDADVCFLSCTALRSAPVIAALESRTGRPVITSNQAMVWYLLRTAGVPDAVKGFGRLFDRATPCRLPTIDDF
jgi:maleate cis-trans isomerase